MLQHQFKTNKDIKFEDIYHAVNQKDPLCSQIIKEAASITGVGISNISNLILPDLIILNGPTYTKMDLFYNTSIQSFYNCNKIEYTDCQINFIYGFLVD